MAGCCPYASCAKVASDPPGRHIEDCAWFGNASFPTPYCSLFRTLIPEVFPRLRSVLCIGGVNTNEQMRIIRQGVHLMTATPGRINDMLTKKRFSLTQCRFLCSQTP